MFRGTLKYNTFIATLQLVTYKIIEQIVEEFVKDRFRYHAKESVLSIDVYEYFNRFCEVNNYDCSISQAKLTIELKKLTYLILLNLLK